MRVIMTNKWDSKGVRIHAQPWGSASAHYWFMWKDRIPCFCITLSFGPGAGYMSDVLWRNFRFRGWTFYLANKAKGGGPDYLYARSKGLRIGITGNGNSVPYSFGG